MEVRIFCLTVDKNGSLPPKSVVLPPLYQALRVEVWGTGGSLPIGHVTHIWRLSWRLRRTPKAEVRHVPLDGCVAEARAGTVVAIDFASTERGNASLILRIVTAASPGARRGGGPPGHGLSIVRPRGAWVGSYYKPHTRRRPSIRATTRFQESRSLPQGSSWKR